MCTDDTCPSGAAAEVSGAGDGAAPHVQTDDGPSAAATAAAAAKHQARRTAA